MSDAQDQQLRYYQETASAYDARHVSSDDEHGIALRYITMYLDWLGAETVLDTGCGTGRAMRHLMEHRPALTVRGNDPSEALLKVARCDYGISAELLDCVSSEDLPYPDNAFDAVVETGVLHHVPRPDLVVSEMLRVSSQAVFLSDSNVYGQGAPATRIAKLLLARIGLLSTTNRLRRGGHECYFSEDDGIAYSYSVFDSYEAVSDACEQVIVIATEGSDRFPLLTASHVLLCGFKERLINSSTGD
jgi:ubiquinone/menaquinone biosynthesis C-methylase UbiE